MHRSDYMSDKVTHAEYYRSMAKDAGVSYANVDPKFLARVKKALAEGDEHLNSIPLHEWDNRTWSLLPSVNTTFKAYGEGTGSLSCRVCLIKQAARDAVAKEG